MRYVFPISNWLRDTQGVFRTLHVESWQGKPWRLPHYIDWYSQHPRNWDYFAVIKGVCVAEGKTIGLLDEGNKTIEWKLKGNIKTVTISLRTG